MICSLDHQALVASGTCVPRSHRTLAIGEMVLGRLPCPGHCEDSRLRCTPESFCEGGLFAYPWAFAWGADFTFGTFLTDTKLFARISGNTGWGHQLGALPLCLGLAHLCLPEKSLHRHTLFYCTLLYCTSQILCFFLQIEGLWQRWAEQVYQCHFPNSIIF